MIDIVIAVFIDWIVGDPYWFPHPIIYIGKLIGNLEKFVRKISKNNTSLKYYGGAIVICVSLVVYGLPYLLLRYLQEYNMLYHIVNIFILWSVLSARCLQKEGMKVYKELDKEDIIAAREKLSYIVGRETELLNEEQIIRADVETIAENTSDGVIAPLLFAIIGGAPFAMLYKGINTMDSMLGYLTKKYKYIGYFPAKVDDIFNYVPARLTGVMMCICAPFVGGNIIKSFKIMIRDRKNHKSPNCAYPEGAAAGAMGIQLGGSNTYFGEVVYKPTIGDKLKDLDKGNIKGAVILMYSSEILIILVASILYYI